jgi:hypothetical protein
LLSVFHSAITTLVTHHNALRSDSAPPLHPGKMPIGGGLSLDAWTRAIVDGADDRSARWTHLLVLGGLLIGLGSQEEQGVDVEWAAGLRKRLESALVKATNLALVDVRGTGDGDGLGGHTVALVLNHSFGCLSDFERRGLDYDVSALSGWC